MRKGTDLIGKPVIDYECGSQLATVKDLIFSQEQDSLLALLTEEAGWFRGGKIVPVNHILAIGADGIIVKSSESIMPVKQAPAIKELIDKKNILRGTQIITLSGRNLGRMVDLYFNTSTGVVEGYEVSGGLFADAYTGRSFVPTSKTFRIGQDFAFVPNNVVELMEEQVGGLKAAMIATGEKAQSFAQQAGEKAQELGTATSEKFSEVQNQALAAITDAVVTPEQQKKFVVGRTANSDVYYQDGALFLEAGDVVTESEAEEAQTLTILDALYRATGGDVVAMATSKASHRAEELKQAASDRLEKATTKAQSAAATYTIEETLGRRVRSMVYNSDGEVIAAIGQIVNYETIEKARQYHQERALINASGLSVTDAVKSQSNIAARQAGGQARELGEQVQTQASQALNWAKSKADSLVYHSGQAIEDQRIKGALGRPVNRVILDP
ncbi:MAG: hypothetical protein HC860_16810, partial [Alkalinema sp. RU_4_3]|nr:hypothetical protein [Alkalinema sp. RU_4_3]